MYLLILTAVVAVFSFLQSFRISFFSVKPDFALAAVVAAIFFVDDIFEGIFLAALAAFLLKFSPYFGSEILVFFAGAVLIAAFGKHLPWHPLINMAVLVSVFTLGFYLVLFPSAVLTLGFFTESLYNILAAGLIFWILSRLKKSSGN